VLEINPYQNFDDLEAELQFYVEETLRAIAMCEDAERRAKDDKTKEYPIVIDMRA